MAIYLIASGALEVLSYVSIRRTDGAGWLLASGLVSLVLGFVIYVGAPLAVAWLVGIVVGFKLFFSGLNIMMMGFVIRNAIQTTVSDS